MRSLVQYTFASISKTHAEILIFDKEGEIKNSDFFKFFKILIKYAV